MCSCTNSCLLRQPYYTASLQLKLQQNNALKSNGGGGRGGGELLAVFCSYRGAFREEVILHDLQLSSTCRCVYILLPRQPRLRKHASEKMGGGDRGRKLRAEGQPALLKKKLRGETGGNASQMKRARLDV